MRFRKPHRFSRRPSVTKNACTVPLFARVVVSRGYRACTTKFTSPRQCTRSIIFAKIFFLRAEKKHSKTGVALQKVFLASFRKKIASLTPLRSLSRTMGNLCEKWVSGFFSVSLICGLNVLSNTRTGSANFFPHFGYERMRGTVYWTLPLRVREFLNKCTKKIFFLQTLHNSAFRVNDRGASLHQTVDQVGNGLLVSH